MDTQTQTEVVFVVAPPVEYTELDYLRAQARFSHAKLYVRQLEEGVNFSRMVDGRGSPFNCSAARWVDIIRRFAAELEPILPDAASELITRLEASHHPDLA